MGLMCDKCFEICYPFENCSVCLRKDCTGNKVEIDNDMLPVVQILNRKGYTTTFSCSGHSYDNESVTYIRFEDSVDLPNIPDGFAYIDYTTISRRIKSKNPTNRQFEIDKNINNLLKWVMSLPYNPLRAI